MGVTAVGWTNAILNARDATFTKRTVVDLIGRLHVDVYHKNRLIFLNIDHYIKLMPSTNNFVIKSAAFAKNAAHENYTLIIQSVNLIIYTIIFTSTAQDALMQLLVHQNIKHHYSRVQITHMSITANQTSINFVNVVTDAFPDLIIVGLVSEVEYAIGHHKNSFNFKKFYVYRIELKGNCPSVASKGYSPNFANGQLIKA